MKKKRPRWLSSVVIAVLLVYVVLSAVGSYRERKLLHAANQVISTLQLELHRRDVMRYPNSIHLMTVPKHDEAFLYRPTEGVLIHALIRDRTYSSSEAYTKTLLGSTMYYNRLSMAKVCDEALSGKGGNDIHWAMDWLVEQLMRRDPTDWRSDFVRILPDVQKGKPDAMAKYETMRDSVLEGGTWSFRGYSRAYLDTSRTGTVGLHPQSIPPPTPSTEKQDGKGEEDAAKD